MDEHAIDERGMGERTTEARALAQRLERAEGMANAAFVEARARVEPALGAEWTEIAGAYAMFDGVGSPLTQAFGAGMFDPFEDEAFGRVEAFFARHGSPTHLEIASVAAPGTTERLASRGYAAIEHSVVLVRDTAAAPAARATAVTVRRIGPDEVAEWAQVSAMGWRSAGEEVSAFVGQLGLIMAQARGVSCFLAMDAGRPIAAAALYLSNGVALLAGASTIPEARGRGAQSALLGARLAHAAAAGIDLAMIVTEPGSASMRNAERAGFRAVHRRTKWARPVSPVP